MKPEVSYTWDDKGMGELFADVFWNYARFNVTAKEWYIYDGIVWKADPGAMIVSQYAKELANALLVYCSTIEDERQKSEYLKMILRYGQLRYRETMVKDARDKFFISQTDLDKIAGKQTLVYFWDCANAAQKMFNLDVLKDLYAEYHPRGLEIYAVCVNPDKASWGRIVKDQGLPWVNVNDGLGAASRSLILYNVQQVPACVLVSDSGITPVEAKERPLRSAIAKALK